MQNGRVNGRKHHGRGLNGKNFTIQKFGQNADKGQIVLAQIWQAICVLRERRCKIAALTAESA